LHLVGERVHRHDGALRHRGVVCELAPHIVNPCHFGHSFLFHLVQSVDDEIELSVHSPKLVEHASLHPCLLAFRLHAEMEGRLEWRPEK
jgi:hypothetical protein